MVGSYSWARLALALVSSYHWAFAVARPAYPVVAGADADILARDPWMMFVPWGEVCGAAASCPEASSRYSGACHALLQGTCCYVLWCAVGVVAVAGEAVALLDVEQVGVAAREEPSLASLVSSMNLQDQVVMPLRPAAALH